MYCDAFLTLCPVCKTVSKFLRSSLHSEVTCTSCGSSFRAEENYVEIEDVEERELHCKELREGIITKGADREECNDYERPRSFERENHSKKPLEWRLVSSEGWQEERTCFERREDQEEQVGAPTEVSSRELEWPHKSKLAAGPASKKRKLSLSLATWGIALRKPSREKRKVKSYSPSRESGLGKTRKLGRLEKGSNVRNGDRTTAAKKYKKKGGEVKIQESAGRSPQDDLWNGDANKGKPTAERTADGKLFSEGYSEEFKDFMAAEIKRQVLEGLGEASKKMVREIQVVEVEEIFPKSQTSEQQFVAQVKLTATLSFPVTLRSNEGAPAQSPEGQKSRDNFGDKCQGRKKDVATENGLDDTKELEPKVMEELKLKDKEKLECKGMEELERKEMEEPKPKDTEELECRDMEEPEFKDTEEREWRECRNMEPQPLLESQKPSAGEHSSENGCEVDVPDSEYYDFEFNRSADKFAANQVWASYDGSLMPRDYVQIKKVVSTRPFKVHIAVLEPAWLAESGNPLSCGEFSADCRVKVLDEINGFSHLMKWKSGQNGMIHIYPGEKEVWALYKNWKEVNQAKRIKHGYDIVQVVGMSEDLTVRVVPLITYKGSSTVFGRKEGEAFRIHEKDFDRFSHQIPLFEIIGHAGVEGCVELDPAAIPSQ